MTEVTNLTIIQINDTHGYLEPHPELVWSAEGPTYPVLGGYARIASILEAERKNAPEAVLVLDNGDTFHGTYPAVNSRGEALIPLVNALKLDAMTAHWEFAWGPPHVEAIASRLDHPVLAINCYDKATGKRRFPASIVLERCGIRIGVIGIAATIIDKTMPPHFSEGVRFTLGVDELPDEIRRLRHEEGVDLVIVLSHLGLPQDIKLAKLVSGIDVLLSGHTHNRLSAPIVVDGTPIIQSGCHGSFLGRLRISVADKALVSWHHELIAVDRSWADAPTMKSLVDSVLAPHRRELEEIVGRTDIGLHRNTMLSAPMDDFLLAAIAMVSNTDIAFSNGWRYGATIPPGPITMNDLWNIIPTNPEVTTVELSGAEIWQMMEGNLERTFAPDPFDQMGGYLKRFRGLSIYGKLENSVQHRIEHIFTSEGRLERHRAYRASYVTAQGVPARMGRDRKTVPFRAVDAMKRYLMHQAIQHDFVGAGRFIPS